MRQSNWKDFDPAPTIKGCCLPLQGWRCIWVKSIVRLGRKHNEICTSGVSNHRARSLLSYWDASCWILHRHRIKHSTDCRHCLQLLS